MAVIDWAKTNFAAYFDNATARRDYRTQMRSAKSVWLWAAYLGLMILVGVYTYGAEVMAELTVVDAQARLLSFYETILYLLAAMVVLVSPALAATAVAIERERRSLDLIVSAPIKPKAFLVGKMIAAYRYTWILLVLALPVTSLCVVLGGATWTEVLAAFAILSFHGLFYSAIALTISSAVARPAAAVVYSYIATLAISSATMGMAMASYTQGSWDGAEQSFLGALSPLTASVAAKSHTTFALPWGSLQVPHWALLGIATLFAVRLLLLGAASSLATSRATETRTLRTLGLVVMAAFSGLCAWAILADPGPAHYGPETLAAGLAALGPLLLIPLLPMMVASGRGGLRRFLPDGWWSWRGAFEGTPAGALPYLLLMTLSSVLPVAVILGAVRGLSPGVPTLSMLAWLLGLWLFLWSLGRFASSFDFDLRTARVLHFALLVGVLGLPIPILIALSPELEGAWLWHPLAPALLAPYGYQLGRLVMGGVLALLGVAIVWLGSHLRKRRAA